jgi:hypothetical protein
VRISGLAPLLFGLTLMLACQRQEIAPLAPLPALDLVAEAAEAMARGDYATSARLLRRVVQADPGRLEAHYRLGVSASHLELIEEATREFEWVVAHGPARSEEVQLARAWLAGTKISSAAPAEHNGAGEPDPKRGALSGSVIWETDGALKPQAFLRLFLKGLKGTPVEDEYYRVETNQEGAYSITGIVPGDYMLTNRVAGPPIWRLKVTLKAGETVRLDLTPDNSVRAQDDFPSTG